MTAIGIGLSPVLGSKAAAVVLAAPANLALSITGAGFDVITATWDAVPSATTYEVEYSDDGVTYAPVDTTALLTYGVTSADYVIAATTHYIRVRAAGGEWAVDTITFMEGLTDLELWLDASDTTTLFQDDAGATPVTADNDPVGKWNDRSGNGNHVTQSTAGNRPIRTTTGGYVAVNGDGTDDNLTRTALPYGDNLTIFTVIGLSGASLKGAWFKNGGGSTGIGVGVGSGTFESNGNNIIALIEGVAWLDSGDAMGTGRALAVVAYDVGIATFTLRLDGTEVYSSAAFGASNPTGGTLSICGYDARYFADDIHMVGFYSRTLTVPEIEQIEAYLMAHWNIT